MNPAHPPIADPVFHPFTVSISDRVHGSNIPIVHIRLRHILFEDTLRELAELLVDTLIRPLAIGEFPLFEIRDRLAQFFAEGAEIVMDRNLEYYDAEELAGIMQQFDPVLLFTVYSPNLNDHLLLVLRNAESIPLLFAQFRQTRLLQ